MVTSSIGFLVSAGVSVLIGAPPAWCRCETQTLYYIAARLAWRRKSARGRVLSCS
jgi:hypothetical protein